MPALTIHSYKGYEIIPCTWADSRRWYIQMYHQPTGLPWDERECPQTYTLADARELIDQWVPEERGRP